MSQNGFVATKNNICFVCIIFESCLTFIPTKNPDQFNTFYMLPEGIFVFEFSQLPVSNLFCSLLKKLNCIKVSA